MADNFDLERYSVDALVQRWPCSSLYSERIVNKLNPGQLFGMLMTASPMLVPDFLAQRIDDALLLRLARSATCPASVSFSLLSSVQLVDRLSDADFDAALFLAPAALQFEHVMRRADRRQILLAVIRNNHNHEE